MIVNRANNVSRGAGFFKTYGLLLSNLLGDLVSSVIYAFFNDILSPLINASFFARDQVLSCRSRLIDSFLEEYVSV